MIGNDKDWHGDIRSLKMISIDRTKFSKILSKFCFQFFAQFSYFYSIHSRRRSRERKRTSIINSEETRSIDFTSRSFVPPFSILLSTLCHCLHSSLQLAFFFFLPPLLASRPYSPPFQLLHRPPPPRQFLTRAPTSKRRRSIQGTPVAAKPEPTESRFMGTTLPPDSSPKRIYRSMKGGGGGGKSRVFRLRDQPVINILSLSLSFSLLSASRPRFRIGHYLSLGTIYLDISWE